MLRTVTKEARGISSRGAELSAVLQVSPGSAAVSGGSDFFPLKCLNVTDQRGNRKSTLRWVQAAGAASLRDPVERRGKLGAALEPHAFPMISKPPLQEHREPLCWRARRTAVHTLRPTHTKHTESQFNPPLWFELVSLFPHLQDNH